MESVLIVAFLARASRASAEGIAKTDSGHACEEHYSPRRLTPFSRKRCLPLNVPFRNVPNCALSPNRNMASWIPIGPGPIINGQAEGIEAPEGKNPVSGCIVDIAPLLATRYYNGNANVIYAAAANGGVWKTTNAMASTPHWIPLTDFALPSLSLGSIAISPVRKKTIFAAAGRFSSCDFDGGWRFGIARSDDEGQTWTTLGVELSDQDIRRVLPTERSSGDVILAAASQGLYRSVDNGARFDPVTAGLRGIGVSDLVADPAIAERFYVAIEGIIYISNNFGEAWSDVSSEALRSQSSDRILLSVHNNGTGSHAVYAMVNRQGHLANVYRSVDQCRNWTVLGVPPEIFPGGAASLHGAIAADPGEKGIVYVAGDRQEKPPEGETENSNGAKDYSGNIFRFVDDKKGKWENLVMRGANHTSPHADSRRLVFDANGDLLYACDGGIFKLKAVSDHRLRQWVSINGNLSPTEAHSAAFDPVSELALSGNQDTGTSVQSLIKNVIWNEVISGDGADVAVDADQHVHVGTSIRYWGYPELEWFNRTIYDASNKMMEHAVLQLKIVSGPGAGKTLPGFDRNIQFYCPFALNRLEPRRMLIGTRYIYESTDYGDSLLNLGFIGSSVGDQLGNNPISYGAKNFDGTSNAGAFFVGAGTNLWHRSADGNAVVAVRFPGGRIRAVVMNRICATQVFVLDANNHAFASSDAGTTWIELTANLGILTKSARTMELINLGQGLDDTILVIGGEGGVWKMDHPATSGATWGPVASGLPRALIYDIRYNQEYDLLLAGTLGRGVWTLKDCIRRGAAKPFQFVTDRTPAERVPGIPTEPSRVASF